MGLGDISDTMREETKDQLRRFVERWERLEEEKKALVGDQREVMAEAKAAGFDTKAIKACIKARKLDEYERLEQETNEGLYRHALGIGSQLDMFSEKPPGKSGRDVLADLLHDYETGIDEFDVAGRRYAVEAGPLGSVILRNLPDEPASTAKQEELEAV